MRKAAKIAVITAVVVASISSGSPALAVEEHVRSCKELKDARENPDVTKIVVVTLEKECGIKLPSQGVRVELQNGGTTAGISEGIFTVGQGCSASDISGGKIYLLSDDAVATNVTGGKIHVDGGTVSKISGGEILLNDLPRAEGDSRAVDISGGKVYAFERHASVADIKGGDVTVTYGATATNISGGTVFVAGPDSKIIGIRGGNVAVQGAVASDITAGEITVYVKGVAILGEGVQVTVNDEGTAYNGDNFASSALRIDLTKSEGSGILRAADGTQLWPRLEQ